MSGVVVGDDGLARCPWGHAPPDNRVYHDTEWGRAVHGDVALFERITLEAFQSGLSWLTILRKREGFRRAFAGFDPEVVARYGKREHNRLMADAAIVRNRLKIDATIANAQALLRLRDEQGDGALDALVWSHRPTRHRRPRTTAEVVAITPESTALSKSLKANGFVFVGPTTMHAAMQACGLIDDHLAACHVTSNGR